MLKKIYPTTHDTDSSLVNYDTDGKGLPNANSMSDWSNGQQQRAFVSISNYIIYNSPEKLGLCLV